MKYLVFAATALAACSPSIYEVPEVAERRAGDVAACQDLGRVRGIPGVYGALKEIGVKDARRAAKERAKEAGGNTVVFEALPQGGEVLEVGAQVYLC